jgi:DNA-binding transcriptional regulator YdaS (Cro superfamily)
MFPYEKHGIMIKNQTPIALWLAASNIRVADAAELLHVSKGTVSKWSTGISVVPAERVAAISAMTGIPREKLRPDIFTEDKSQ